MLCVIHVYWLGHNTHFLKEHRHHLQYPRGVATCNARIIPRRLADDSANRGPLRFTDCTEGSGAFIWFWGFVALIEKQIRHLIYNNVVKQFCCQPFFFFLLPTTPRTAAEIGHYAEWMNKMFLLCLVILRQGGVKQIEAWNGPSLTEMVYGLFWPDGVCVCFSAERIATDGGLDRIFKNQPWFWLQLFFLNFRCVFIRGKLYCATLLFCACKVYMTYVIYLIPRKI